MSHKLFLHWAWFTVLVRIRLLPEHSSTTVSHALFSSLTRLVSQWWNLGFPVYHFPPPKIRGRWFVWFIVEDIKSINFFVAYILVYIYHFEIVNVTDRSDVLCEANKITSVWYMSMGQYFLMKNSKAACSLSSYLLGEGRESLHHWLFECCKIMQRDYILD